MAIPRFQTYKNQVKLNPGQTLAFTAGKGYYGKPGSGVASALGGGGAPDPFAPLSDADIQKRAANMVNAETNPYLETLKTLFGQQRSDLEGAYQRRLSAGSGAVTSYTRALTGDLGQYIDRAKAAYGEAQGAQRAADDEVSSELKGAGSQVASALSSRLGQAGLDPAMVESLAADARATGAGAGAAGFAKGTAELSKLIGEGAHAAEYAGKLPGIATLGGLQQIKQLVAQLAAEQADKEAALNEQQSSAVGDVTSKVPGEIASLVNSMQGRELQKAVARQSGLLSTARTKATVTAAKTRANAKTKSDATKAAQPDPSLSRAYGYKVDANGNPVGGTVTPLPGYHTDKSGNVVKDAKPAKPPKPLTTTDKHRLSKLADDLRYGVAPKQQFNSKTQQWMDVPNTGTPNSSYGEAYNQLVGEGAPPKYARALVNRLYKAGEFGRPLTKAQKTAKAKTAAAVKSGLGLPKPPFDAFTGG